MTDNQKCQDQQITSIADAVVKLKELRESNKNLNEPDIEERYARLALAFKTDKFTLSKRLDLQKRQRDIAEKNIETELDSLRESLNALNQLCTESDMREIITKTQQHVDIVQQATHRMSSRAETYGAIQQEERLNCAFETMLNYVEHLKLLYDKEHLELEEYRRLLAEHNLLPGEKGSAEGEDSKRVLPPRSHSLSSSSKPENRTRLLSSVCLLNNNYESNRAAPSSSSPGSISPKNRRSSLPASNYGQATSSPLRTHNSIHEMTEAKMERRGSQSKSPVDSGLQKNVESGKIDENIDSNALKETSEGSPDDKDSSEITLSHLSSPDQTHASNSASSLQESTCDNEIEDICLLPEISIPVKPKSLYFLNLIQWASLQRVWRWDNATLILHARYTLSVMLATAAMLTFVLTFVPNQVLAHETKDYK